MKKKLVDALVAGIGLAAGKDLYDKAKDALFTEDAPPDPKAVEKEKKLAAEAAKKAEKDAARAKKDRERARVKLEKEVDDDLAALKKKLRK